jgi:hypothetical protein
VGRIVAIGANIKDWVRKKGKGKDKDERQRLYDQLEKLWPKAVKITYGHFDGNYYYCEMCGKPCKSGEGAGVGLGIKAHHVEGKQSYNLRWLVINGTPLCPTCHTMGRNSAHQDRTIFLSRIIGLRGQEWYDRLLKIKGEKKKWDIAEMKKKKEELQKIIAKE